MSVYKKVFVLFPQGVKTGGPKCLHQLVKALRDRGVEAFLSPLSGTERKIPVNQYEIYGCPIGVPADSEDCLVISPENTLRDLSRFRKAGQAIWWLSVDFGVPFELRKAAERKAGGQKILRIFLRHVFGGEYFALNRLRRRGLGKIHHFAHSEYCAKTVHDSLGLSSLKLSDYTEPETASDTELYSLRRERVSNQVAYNPKKGAKEVAVIEALMPSLNFVPVQNMTHDEVIGVLAQSSAYLDLGHFPGKDHLPREANRARTPVVIASRGSGRFEEDFRLTEEFKISLSDSGWEQRVVKALESVISNPDLALAKQQDFSLQVQEERENFDREVDNLISALQIQHPPVPKN